MNISSITHKGNIYPLFTPESPIDYIIFIVPGAFIREDSRLFSPNRIICANKYVPFLYYPVRRADYYLSFSYSAVILPLAPFFILARYARLAYFRTMAFINK
jgi:hypothetical protein